MPARAKQIGIRTIALALRVIPWLLATQHAALAQGRPSKQSFLRTVSEGFAQGPPPQAQLITTLTLVGALLLIIATYYLHRRMQEAQLSESRSTIESALSQIQGHTTAPRALSPGDLVEIEYIGEKSRRVYASRVQDVSDDTVLLAAPRQEGALIPLRSGDPVGVIVKGKPYSYRFQTEVLDRRMKPLPGLLVRRVNRVTRYQRRSFYRVPVEIECEYEVFQGGVPPASLSRKGTITNLSGSGCRIQTSRPVGRARYFVIEFALPGERQRMRVTAEIVKRNTDRPAAGQDGSIACNFIEIKHTDRERLVKYVMSADRKRIRHMKGRQDEPPRRHPSGTQVVTPRPPRRGG
jgi:c-di-GMP-binding flagellar brake protein YcgR